jgi:putative methyltransferase (TIGR04325 family)
MNLNKIKIVAKRILPSRIAGLLTGLFYGWTGNYSTWDKALKKSSGYNSQLILDKVSLSAGKVHSGEAAYERDSVIFNEINYSFPVLSALLWVAVQNNGRLNVLDFGGSLGSSYFQNKKFLDSVNKVNWCIVEQPAFVEEGNKKFSGERLHFFNRNDDCFDSYEIDVVLLSSVLQYLEEPYKVLNDFISKGIKYIIVDRTPFIKGKDRITIQKVHPAIYKASYPCWFFNEAGFLSCFNRKYDLITEFRALDEANIRSEFKGFIFRIKTEEV